MAFQSDSIYWVEVEKIVPNPYQPRREFDEAKLKELSESIRMYGILQPLTVTRKEIQREDGTFYSEYELIAGERRLRASKLAGLAQVPVIIRDGEDTEQEKLELAIIENLQREDLNAVDRAMAFRQLADVFNLSHAKIAKKVGRSREYVSNTLRLLLLPEYMLTSLKEGDITEGHGRTLLMLNDKPEEQDTVFREILLKKLSVRQVEKIARKIANDKVRSHKWKDLDPELIALEKQFTETLGTRVQIDKTDYGGKVTIDYFSEDDLTTLLALVQQKESASVAAGAAAALATTPVAAGEGGDDAEVPVVSPEPPAPAADTPEPPPVGAPEQPSPAPTPEPASGQLEAATPLTLTSTPAAEVPGAPTEPVPPSEPAAVAPAPAEPSGSEPDPSPQPAATPKPPTDEDESDLYAIRNFGV
jgi:ParB family chromosome partitioning protein